MISNFITETIISIDQYTNILLYSLRHPLAIKIFNIITLLGESWTIIIFVLITSITLYTANKKWQIIGLWLTVGGSVGFTFLAKIFFDRPRPISALIIETSPSFPSAHAAVAISFYGFILYLLFKKMNKKRDQILVALFGLILIALIGFSRLYLGVHYLSDVLIGYLVGLLWLIIGTKLNNYSPPLLKKN